MAFRGFSTYLDLYVALRNHKDLRDYDNLFNTLKSSTNVQLSESDVTDLKNWCRRFCYRVYTKWVQSRRTVDRFINKNGEWLNSDIVWPDCFKENVVDTEEANENEAEEVVSPSKSDASTSTYTSPRKRFEDLSTRHKRRRVNENVASCSRSDELLHTVESILKSAGKNDMARIMKNLLENPEHVSTVLNVLETKQNPSLREVPTHKALALYVYLQLSKWRYITLRDFSLKEGHAKYPSYYLLVKEKLKCYPAKEDITVTETSAKIRIQALLDLTVRRLIDSLESNFDAGEPLVLHSKWGFDGASSQSIYHQTTTTSEQDLSSVFMASLVPLKLVTSSGSIVWQNDRPSSTTYCRPISFTFMKETEANVKAEMEIFETEIRELNPTDCGNATVTHNLWLTMIDGKVHSIISGTSAAVCDLCKARPSEMNNLEEVRAKPVNTDLYKHGFSSLHAWIRSMECLLHIAYRMDIKSWQAKGDENKKKVKDKKEAIQEAFRRSTGLLLDVVKQGSGNTNTGNAARRFFANPETTAEITKLDVNLIRRLAVILQCISSGEKIQVQKFKLYCDETANLFVELYPWYNMPASLHKLLIHGSQIVDHLSVVPIGFLSEEASEARNKDFRKFREYHTRKHSSIATNEDILHNLLLSSDPLLTSLRPKMTNKAKKSSFSELDDLLIVDQSELEFIDVSTDTLAACSDVEEDDDDNNDHDVVIDEDEENIV